MGNFLGTASRDPEFESGIFISPGLLNGKTSAAPTAQPIGLVKPNREAEIKAAITERLSRDKDLQEGLIISRRAGHLLLKKEEEELAQVQQFADEMIKKEYSAPSRDNPCQEHRDATVECYRKNSQDVLQCAATVAAYSSCADLARKQWAQSSQAIASQ